MGPAPGHAAPLGTAALWGPGRIEPMKTEIHPEYGLAHVRCACGNEFYTRSTKPELHVEIWSGNHPFYTGQQRLVDTEGQVERFYKRLEARETIETQAEQLAESKLPVASPVEEIPLNKRAMNALKSDGLNTVGDVLQRLEQGDDGLLAITGVGQKALIDIKKYMRANNLIE